MSAQVEVATGTFAARLRELRLQRGWSQITLAVRADMSTNHLAYLEQGCGEPSLYTIRKLAGALGMSISRMMENVE